MRTRPIPMTLILALLVGGLGVLMLHTIAGFGGLSRGGLFDHCVYGVLMGGAAFTVLARGVIVQAQRAAWLTMGAGVLCWSLGDLYYALFVEGPRAAGGSVTPADALYLVFYPCCYVALVLLLGAHLRELRIGMWLDGLIGGLAAAAVGAAVILPPILHGAHGEHRLVGGRARVPNRGSAAAGIHARRARHDRLAPRASLAADRGLDARERGRGLRLPLPHRHRQLPCGRLDTGPVASLRSAAGDRRMDPLATARAPADGGLAIGVGALALAARRPRGADLRQPSPHPAHPRRPDPRDRDRARCLPATADDRAREHHDAHRLPAPGADRPADRPRQSPAADGGPARRLPPRERGARRGS